jgi:hypothetical protein
MNDRDIEHFIEGLFQANYRRLLAEGGAHILTPRALEQAREQVLHYWRRLGDVAMTVTETEVRLQLPNQRTPRGRAFVIEGVVDLVREADRVRMYDIKTHYCGEVQNNLKSYAGQLNLYAYIWRELRGQELHELGVIAIQLPEALRVALRDGKQDVVRKELEAWNPLVSIPMSQDSLQEVFDQIAETVDRIEDGDFQPPPAEKLRSTEARDASNGGRPVAFATLHCRNCDGRFSCDSYREYMLDGRAPRRRFDLSRYLSNVHDDGDLDSWIDGNIELDLDRLFPEETRD